MEHILICYLDLFLNTSNIHCSKICKIYAWSPQKNTSSYWFWCLMPFSTIYQLFFRYIYTVLLQDVEDYVVLHVWVQKYLHKFHESEIK
jgi:hypothetical protein